MCQLIGLSLYFFNNFTTSHNLSCTYLVSFHPLLLPHRQSFSHQNRFLLLCSLLFTAQGPALRSFCTKKPFPCVATSPQRGISSFLCAKVKLTTPFDLCIVLKSHFRQLGNQKETLMVEIPTVASPSPLFEVLYQQHLSKFF